MTITVGTDTYITLADARTYVSASGLTPLPSLDSDAEALLKRATYALDRIYGNRYLGMKKNQYQQLAWPRLFAESTPHGVGEWPYIIVDSDGNPRDFTGIQPECGFAECELAVMLQAGVDVYAQPEPQVNFDRSVVGSLEREIRTSDPKSYRKDPLYKISLILRPLLKIQAGSLDITRGA